MRLASVASSPGGWARSDGRAAAAARSAAGSDRLGRHGRAGRCGRHDGGDAGRRVEVLQRATKHVAMVALALQRQPEGGGGVRPALLLGLADHPRQDDVDLQHLAGGRVLEVLAGRADRAHHAQVVERVDRLGSGGLEEQLRDLGAALVEGLESVGEIATVGVRLAGERHLEVRLGLRADGSHGGAHCSLDPGVRPARMQSRSPP